MAIDSRSFGPDQAALDAQKALGYGGAAAKVAGVPYADVATGLGRLFTDPSTEGALTFAGRAATDPGLWAAGLKAAESGWPSVADIGSGIANTASDVASAVASALAGEGLADLGSLAASLGSGLVGYLAMLPFMMFAPGGLKHLVTDEPAETTWRRMRRSRDAARLEGQMAQGLEARNLNAPVGGSTVGDALARILKYEGEGTWYTDTSHNWRPDPYLEPARQALWARGYGDTEPTAGDVGGVGEMVMGGGLRLIDPSKREAMNNAYTARYGVAPTADTPEGELIQPYYANTGESPYLSAAQGWNTGLRRLFGVPDSAPNPWDFDKPVTYHADPMGDGQIPDASPALDYQKFLTAGGTGAAEWSNPENTYVQYLDMLNPATAAGLREYEAKKYARNQAITDSILNPGG